jgi:hypothetical protein
MDQPKTRRESKKDQREKGEGKNGKYSAKHVRETERLLSKQKSSPPSKTPSTTL